MNPPQLRRAARDTNRRKDLSLISVALEQYYADYNHYPDTGALDCLQSTLNGSDGSCSSTVGSTVYIKVMPTSQSATALEYCYYAEPSGNPQNFLLCAPLEAEPTAVSPIEDTGNCAISSPVTGGSLGTDFGSYCIENPF